jgi:plasmid stabilization system protein ParE
MAPRHEVRITATAEKDLKEVFLFISRDSPARAAKFIGFLAAQAMALEKFPLRCPLVPENQVLGTNYRHLVYGDYRIIFKIEENKVFVLRVVHGARLMDEETLAF